MFLINEKNVDPLSILVITFSNAAAKELQERFHNISTLSYPVSFGTFHSIFYQILKSGNSSPLKILNQDKKYIFLKTILLEYKQTSFEELIISDDIISKLLSQFSLLKNTISLFRYEEIPQISEKAFYFLFQKYQHLLKDEEMIDFDDMLYQCKQLLQKSPSLTRYFQNKYHYILVDEFQDINPIQYELIRLLAFPQNNLFVVGDDDQSIYGFRGSTPQLMQQFMKDYQNCTKLLLTTNYRSSASIINFSQKVICENKNRLEKGMISGQPEGVGYNTQNEVIVKGFLSKEEEYAYIISTLKVGFNVQNTTACIFRTNMEATLLAELLTKEKICFTKKIRIQNPYKDFIFRDFIHYLNLAATEDEKMLCSDFAAVMNRPKRYLKRSILTQNTVSFDELHESYKDKNYMHSILEKFRHDLSFIKNMDLFCAVNYIRKAIGYDNFLMQYAMDEKKESIQQLLERADMIQSRMKYFNTIEELNTHAKQFETECESALCCGDNTKESRIVLLTYHVSKGLEFDRVFLPDCNEGTIPSHRCNNNEQIEEERRMFYVGMTRAKEELQLLYVKGDKSKKYIPSRFLPKKHDGI